MGFNEFKELFTALNGWKQNFMMFDQDRSGTVEPHEMSQAINSMGEPETSSWLWLTSPSTLSSVSPSDSGRI